MNDRNSLENDDDALSSEAVRQRLDLLIRSSGIGYAELSRRIGRNPAYLQQFIKRGVPRRLGETERRLLAQHFGVPEQELGAPLDSRLSPDAARHRVHSIGRLARPETRPLSIDDALVAHLAPAVATRLVAHVVEGDSMAPTLHAGDLILVDPESGPPRDGLYVMEGEGLPIIRRLAVNPVSRRIAILADNAAYPSFPDCDPADIRLVGRIMWMSRPVS